MLMVKPINQAIDTLNSQIKKREETVLMLRKLRGHFDHINRAIKMVGEAESVQVIANADIDHQLYIRWRNARSAGELSHQFAQMLGAKIVHENRSGHTHYSCKINWDGVIICCV